jgi:hypothetical protein
MIRDVCSCLCTAKSSSHERSRWTRNNSESWQTCSGLCVSATFLKNTHHATEGVRHVLPAHPLGPVNWIGYRVQLYCVAYNFIRVCTTMSNKQAWVLWVCKFVRCILMSNKHAWVLWVCKFVRCVLDIGAVKLRVYFMFQFCRVL